MGVRLWAENDLLRYEAPDGVLTAANLAELRSLKTQILEFLKRPSPPVVGNRIPRRLPNEVVPLTFSQKWLWNLFELATRPSMRAVAAAVRIFGNFDSGLLRCSLTELVRQHESLRTQIVMVDGIPRQVCVEARNIDLEIIDCGEVPEFHIEMRVREVAEHLTQETVLVDRDPLFAARLLKFSIDSHVLIIAVDHLVADGASIGIIGSEIFTLYSQFVSRLPLCPPDDIVQFPDYAVWQNNTYGLLKNEHGAHWRGRFAGARRVSLASEATSMTVPSAGWAKTPVEFGEDLSVLIHEFSRGAKATPAMVVLAAYFAVLFLWCDTHDLVIPFLTMGRSHANVAKTIGYFGHSLFLRVKLFSNDHFLDLLARVIREYEESNAHDDCGEISALLPVPEFVWNPAFSWNPQEFNMVLDSQPVPVGLNGVLKLESLEIETTLRNDMRWEGEPRLDLTDGRRGIVGSFTFRTNRFDMYQAQQLEYAMRKVIEQLLEKPTSSINSVSWRP